MFEFHGIKSNFEFVLWHFLNFFPALSLQNRPTLQNTDSNSISVYSENNAYLNIYLYMINTTKYASNKKTQILEYKYGRFRGSVGMGIPWGFPRDFAVGMGWVWGLKFNPHGSSGNRARGVAVILTTECDGAEVGWVAVRYTGWQRRLSVCQL